VDVAARRGLQLSLLLTLCAAAIALTLIRRDPPAFYDPGPPAPNGLPTAQRLSLLAVGDTGRSLPFRPFAEGQRSVARGLAAEDRRAPVDALLLLGDNFYPDGLEPQTLVKQIRKNLVGPYCRFAALDGPRAAEVRDACALPPEARHPVAILAVLGNHDYNLGESPELERRTIPLFLSNWRTTEADAEVVELGEGVSLVLADASRIGMKRSAQALVEALERARGPWRILATHEPIALREDRPARPGSTTEAMRRAIAAASVPVQLVLTGHRHNLQVMTPSLPKPGLHVIVGGGSSRKPLRWPPFEERRFAIETTGFARVDLLGSGDEQGLLVSLFTMPRHPIYFWAEPRLVSRWWVNRAGHAYQVFPPPKSRDSRSSSETTR